MQRTEELGYHSTYYKCNKKKAKNINYIYYSYITLSTGRNLLTNITSLIIFRLCLDFVFFLQIIGRKETLWHTMIGNFEYISLPLPIIIAIHIYQKDKLL